MGTLLAARPRWESQRRLRRGVNPREGTPARAQLMPHHGATWAALVACNCSTDYQTRLGIKMADEDDDLGVWTAKQLVGGAIGTLGSSFFTYGLAQAGITLPDGDDLSSQLASIQQSLTQIVGMLTTITNQLHDAEDHLLAAIQKSEFNTIADNLEQGIIGDIVGLTQRYQTYVASVVASNETPDALAQERESILADIEAKLVDNQLAIHKIVAGSGGSGADPLYKTYFDAINPKRFLSYVPCDAMQARINYYQSMQYLQQLLVVTYYNAKGLPDQAFGAIKTFQDNMVDENRFQVMPIPKGVLIDPTSNLVLYVGPNKLVHADEAAGAWATPPNGAKSNLTSSTSKILLAHDIHYYDIPGFPAIRAPATYSHWRNALLHDLIGHSNAQQYCAQVPDWLPNTPDKGIFDGYDPTVSGETGEQYLFGGYPDGGGGSGRLWVNLYRWQWAVFDITAAAQPTWTVTFDQSGDDHPRTNDVAYPLLVRNRQPGAPWEIDDSLLKMNGDAGYRRPVLLQAADTGKYWSRTSPISNTDDSPIWAVKETPDAFCQFQITYRANGTVTIRADNGKFLSRIALDGGANPIEATKDVADQFCEFGITSLANGKIVLIADNGKLLANTNRGFKGVPGPSIEAAKDAATDTSCQINLTGAGDKDPPGSPWWQTSWPAPDGTQYVIQLKTSTRAGAYLTSGADPIPPVTPPPGAHGAKVALSPSGDTARQHWTFEWVAPGVYRIKPAGLAYYLSCDQDDGGVNLWSVDDNTGRQQWTLTATGDGSFTITIEKPNALKNPASKYLSTRPDGSVIDLANQDGSDYQRWLVSVPK